MSKAKRVLLLGILLVVSWSIGKPAALGEQRILRIAEYSDSPKIRELFLETHPDVIFEDVYLEAGQSYPLDYVRGDKSVDILELSSISGLVRLIREGLVQDLSASPVICEQFETYIPQIQTVLSQEGKPMGIVTHICFHVWDYDKEKWEISNLPELPKTYDELFDFLLLWKERYGEQFGPDYPVVSNGGTYNYKTAIWEAVTYQYAVEHATDDGPVNFDTPEYRLIMERLIALPTEKIFSEFDTRLLIRFSSLRQMLFSSVSFVESIDGYEEFIKLSSLQLDGNRAPKVGAYLFALCLSSNAPSPELALEYLSFMAAYYSVHQPELVYSFTGGAESLPTFPLSIGLLSSTPGSGVASDGIRMPTRDPGKYEMVSTTPDLYKEILPYLTFGPDPSYALRMDQESDGADMPWEDGLRGIQSVDELILELNEAAKRNWLRYYGE